MSDTFLGEIKMFGFNWPPRGFSLCGGQLINVQNNTALFSLLGTYFGGDGVQTFKLPDLRSRVAVGQGQGLGLSLYQIGEMTGNEATQLTISNMPIHSHQATISGLNYTAPTYTAPTAATTITALAAPTARTQAPGNNYLTVGFDPTNNLLMQNYAASGNGTAVTMNAGMATTTLSGGGVSGGSVSGGTVTVANNGGSLPFANLQPLLAMNYSIAVQGVYPSRN